MAYTLGGVREEIARAFGRYSKFTATGGSTTTAVSTSGLFEPDDFWNQAILYVRTDAGGASAAPESEYRFITDYDQASQTATVTLAFTATIASGDVCEIYGGNIPPGELDNIIERAVKAATAYWYVPTWDDSTLDFTASTYTYSLPTDVDRLRRVYFRESSSYRWKSFPFWEITGLPGAYVLKTKADPGAGDMALAYEATLALTGSGDARILNLLTAGETSKDEQHCVEWLLHWVQESIFRKISNEGDDNHRNYCWNMMRYHGEEANKKARLFAMPPMRGQTQLVGWQGHDTYLREAAYASLSRGGTKPGT